MAAAASTATNGEALLFKIYTSRKTKVQEFARKSLNEIQKRADEAGQKNLAKAQIQTFATKVAKQVSQPADAKVNAEFIVKYLETKLQPSAKAAAKKADLQIVKLFKAIVAGKWSISEGSTKQSAVAPKTPKAASAAAPQTPSVASAAGVPETPATPTTPALEALTGKPFNPDLMATPTTPAILAMHQQVLVWEAELAVTAIQNPLPLQAKLEF
jgi:hypothetical protein